MGSNLTIQFGLMFGSPSLRISPDYVRETELRMKNVKHTTFERNEAIVVYYWLQAQTHKQRSNVEKLLEICI